MQNPKQIDTPTTKIKIRKTSQELRKLHYTSLPGKSSLNVVTTKTTMISMPIMMTIPTMMNMTGGNMPVSHEHYDYDDHLDHDDIDYDDQKDHLDQDDHLNRDDHLDHDDHDEIVFVRKCKEEKIHIQQKCKNERKK